ncbi:MAG: PHP domain-containing protein [Saccharofermentanales bacterium]
MKLTTLSAGGSWFKGNTHTHTTLSDGTKTPQETAARYRDNGYSFLFISDHNIYMDHRPFETPEFLLIPAVERDIGVPDEVMKCFHIVGINDAASALLSYNDGEQFAAPGWDGIRSVQTIIDDLSAHGNLCILAHPVWSRNEMDDLRQLSRGLLGIEIYNNVCEFEWNNGQAQLYWDLLWKDGIRLWGFASDDSHNPDIHAFGGWIAVKAGDLSASSIVDALKSGSFYSSTGPSIDDFYVENGEAYVECSDAVSIHFMTYDNLGRSFYAPPGETISSAVHRLTGQEKFVRVEVCDRSAKRAWSNPIWLG